MTLDPQAEALLAGLKLLHRPPVSSLSVAENRAALKAMTSQGNIPPQPVAGVGEHLVPVPGGEIKVRVYTPATEPPRPVLVFFHGGGFVMGDLDDCDPPLRALANAAGCIVVSAGYRLAPEYKFPTAPEDCYRALLWTVENAASLGGDPGRVAVAGDSAGGNLATVVCLMVRERGGPAPRFQALIYPATDLAGDYPSLHEFATGYFLEADAAAYFNAQYCRSPEDVRHCFASPILAPDLGGLPPALVVTGGYDPLRDQGEAYARKLEAAGVRVVYHCYGGMIHGFWNMGRVLEKGRELIEEVAAFSREEFSRR